MRLWIKGIAALLAIALLLFVGWRLLQGLNALVFGADLRMDAEPDPMFAQEAQTVTRPPELDYEEAQPDHPTLDDYVPEVETPVEVTADELIRRAEETSNS